MGVKNVSGNHWRGSFYVRRNAKNLVFEELRFHPMVYYIRQITSPVCSHQAHVGFEMLVPDWVPFQALLPNCLPFQ